MKDKCIDCIFWERSIERSFKCMDKESNMYGHVMKNWCWAGYTEIEPAVNKHGKCKRLMVDMDNTEGMLWSDGRNPESVYTNEDFGCVLFKAAP